MKCRSLLLFTGSILLTACAPWKEPPHATMQDISRAASDLPPPITRSQSETVVIELETQEVVAKLADNVTYEYWTYNGTVPGPFLRVREGDTVEVRLKHALHDDEGEEHAMLRLNPIPPAVAHGSEEEHAVEEEGHADDGHGNDPVHELAGHGKHSIDLHSVLGPGGGAVYSQTKTGKTSVFRFRALRPGLYVYHCASPHVPTHIANGMYGMILVEPKEGLPPVDREFYVMQGELYTSGKLGEHGHQAFSREKLFSEAPEYVVFNGRVGALRGSGALTANVGERIRLYVGVGTFLPSSFHIIGGILENLYPKGDLLSPPHKNVQTTLIPAGGAAVVEFTPQVPGTYLLVDHSLVRAIDRGALAELVVKGPPNPQVFSAVNPDSSHTHADLAIWIEGKKVDLSDKKYMQSEESGDSAKEENPHLHDGVGHVIHRHKPGQSIGGFLGAIGIASTRQCVTLGKKAPACNQEGKQWQMFVNGTERPFDPSYVFTDIDSILLTFGATAEQVQEQLRMRTDDACLYSRTCPERGEPPEENCIADPAVPCTE